MMLRNGPDDVRSRKQGLIDALGGNVADPAPNPALGNTGVSGGLPVLADKPMPASPIADAPAAAAPASNYARTMGFDSGKFNDPNKHDFKYDVGRTLSQFDPKAGFTPEVLGALNQLGYGSFSGSGDKLSLTGAKNAKDAADFSNQDWIYAHDAQNDATKWNFGGGGAAGDAGAASAQGAGLNAGRPSFAGSTVAPMLQADAQSNIQQALQNIGGLSNTSRLQQLIAALSGGGQ